MGMRTKDSSVARRPPVDETVAPIHFDLANGNHLFMANIGRPACPPPRSAARPCAMAQNDFPPSQRHSFSAMGPIPSTPQRAGELIKLLVASAYQGSPVMPSYMELRQGILLVGLFVVVFVAAAGYAQGSAPPPSSSSEGQQIGKVPV
jgi:hypothetical protein